MHDHPACQVHIEFSSVFAKHRLVESLLTRSNLIPKYRGINACKEKTIKVWYTGENLTPPKGFDFTMSFNHNSSTNIYWPLWATYTRFGNMKFESDREFQFVESELLRPRNLKSEERMRKACVFLSSNKDLRFKVCKQLEEMGIVDIYGASVNRSVDSKLSISKEYAFQLCFENSDDDLYVTEKLFEAWASGNIPIYKHKQSLPFLNRSAILEVQEIDALQIRDKIKGEVDLDRVISQPILSRKFETSFFNEKLLSLVEQKCGK